MFVYLHTQVHPTHKGFELYIIFISLIRESYRVHFTAKTREELIQSFQQKRGGVNNNILVIPCGVIYAGMFVHYDAQSTISTLFRWRLNLSFLPQSVPTFFLYMWL